MNQKEAVKLAVIETNLKNIGDKLESHIKHDESVAQRNDRRQSEILKKLDNFISSVDKTYTRKNEFADLKERVDNMSQSTQNWVRAAIPWVLAIVMIIITIWSVVK